MEKENFELTGALKQNPQEISKSSQKEVKSSKKAKFTIFNKQAKAINHVEKLQKIIQKNHDIVGKPDDKAKFLCFKIALRMNQLKGQNLAIPLSIYPVRNKNDKIRQVSINEVLYQ